MKTIITLFFVVSLSIFTITPLFNKGFFEFHDNTQVVRVYEMGKMLMEKVFPVRWVPDLGYGYGYPIFNFYGPLPYYVGGGFSSIGFDALASTKLMFGVGILLSAITMFFFARKFFGETGALLSSVIYAYFPYHAVNIYVRGAVGEFFAYAFLPLLFLGLYQLLDVKKLNGYLLQPVLLIVFSFFLIATSHNLSIFMVLVLLLPLLLTGIIFAKSRKIFVYVSGISLLCGFLLSSFYIIPAFLEMGYTNVSSQVGGGADFRDHFVCLGQFWDGMWGYGGSIAGCDDGLSFKLGKLNVLLLILSLIFLGFSFYRKKLKTPEKMVIVSFVLLIVCFLLTLSVSELIWVNIPYMDYIQYPWRFINFIALFMSFLSGFCIYFIKERVGTKVAYIALMVIAFFILIGNQKLFLPQSFNSNSVSFYTEREYVSFTVSKISDEYMPRGFGIPQNYSEVPSDIAEFENEKGNISIEINKPYYLKINYEISADGFLHINRAFFPSWRAYINGIEAPIYPVKNGMNVSITRGVGLLELKFKNTPVQTIGNTLTIIAFLALFAVIIIVSRAKKRK
ncbi:MAG: 6-pyruvoyl-tetrahydropterin synthase-related protein [Candidatus Levybacteria bacterium]|nr:6-pyruvoyl-tetrahydropterin synthase-related protein [Candidatus Levybacteria bacterium]